MSADGFDVAVIGAGVIGLAIAEAVAAAGRSVVILEQEGGIARGVTSRNSEVIHAGIYYPADSLKALTCVEGRERLYRWCDSHRVDHRRLGKLIVATDETEVDVLEDLLRRGRANGVSSLELIDGARVSSIEPAVSAIAALESRDTGIVDAHGLCLSLLASAESKGAILALERRVEGAAHGPRGWRIDASVRGVRESLEAECVVDAGGLDADRIAEKSGLDVDAIGWRQHPCKGDYFALAPGSAHDLVLPTRLIYPVPQKAGLGIHATLDLAGRIRFGPDATYVSGSGARDDPRELDFEVDAGKADHFREAVARYLPALGHASLVPDYAGIRPKLAGPDDAFRDFVIEECSQHGAPGLVVCLGIESPGLTSALALAPRVAQLLGIGVGVT